MKSTVYGAAKLGMIMYGGNPPCQNFGFCSVRSVGGDDSGGQEAGEERRSKRLICEIEMRNRVFQHSRSPAHSKKKIRRSNERLRGKMSEREERLGCVFSLDGLAGNSSSCSFYCTVGMHVLVIAVIDNHISQGFRDRKAYNVVR